MRRMHQYGPGTSWADSRFHFHMVLVEACIVSAVIYACSTFGLFVFFLWGIPQLQSDWSLSCDHGLDYVLLVRSADQRIATLLQPVLNSSRSRVTGACPVTTDLIMRVNVRTATTTVVDRSPR